MINTIMDAEWISFFEYLADRMRNENDLSDITFALCKSNKDFQNLFLNFCFDENLDTDDLSREYAEGDSRPDFFFHDNTSKIEYVLEVKIFDRNQHFKQYQERFPNAKYAFIANYDFTNIENWKIRTWKGFYNHLLNSEIISNPVISGYLQYLKSVTNIMEFKKINLKACKSLPTLIENLKVILIQEFNFTEYNSAKSFSVDYYGQFFMKNDLYFWIGIYLHDNNLYIGFNDSDYWVPETIRNNIKTLIKTNKKTDYYRTTEEQDGNYGKFWFCMENMKCLCSEDSNLEVQKKSLKDFIKAVFRDIGVEKYLS